MKWYIRINFLLSLIMLITSLCSCENHYNDIKKRFELYSSDGDMVVVLDDHVFYFNDHTLNLNDLVGEGEEPNGGYLFLDKTLYFSTTKRMGFSEFSVCVYTCDLYGNEKNLVFERQSYKTYPRAVGKQGVLYFEYYDTHAFDETAREIVSYDVLREIYELEGTGENASLSNYRNQGNGRIEGKGKLEYSNNTLTWVDSKDYKTHLIDLAKTEPFDKALNGLDYSYTGCTVSSERLFLIYRIEEYTGEAVYPHFVCEYVPETHEIHFKFFAFTYDITGIEVMIMQ